MKRIVWSVAAALGVTLLLCGVWLLDLPNRKVLDTELLENLQNASIVYDRDGNEVFSLYGTQQRRSVDIAELPEYVPQAFIAAEDQRFYRHSGIDIRRIASAALNNLRSGGLEQGASTITQQLIKLTHLSSEKTFRRKIQEARLAIEAERIYTKDEILGMYMNVIYFGKGAYGIEAAANTYFGKSADELTVSQAALLAGIIKSPNRYSPANSMELALNRRDYVLEQMKKCGFIDEEVFTQAQQETISLAEAAESGLSGWYRDAVISEATRVLNIPTEALLGGGYRIYTALDARMQAQADVSMADPEAFPAEDVEGALIAVDPADGGVRALVGGRNDDARMALNRATDARRQPGSVIKPISVYAAAIDSCGYLPSDFQDDTQRVFAGGYMPRNAKDRYYGMVTLRTALSKSLNVVAVSLADEIGIAAVRNYARRFGVPVETDDASLAFALGSMTYGMTPAEVAGAYASLANGGMSVEPHTIERILDAQGREIYRYQAKRERIISEETAYLLTDMLRTAVQNGSAHELNRLDFPVAAKTGTVSAENGTRDIWTAAYTPEICVSVWMGYDSSADGVMQSSASGSGFPAKMAAEWLDSVSGQLSGGDFAAPASIQTVMLDRIVLEEAHIAVLAGEHTPEDEKIREVYPADRVPVQVSDRYQTPEAVADATLETNVLGYPVIRFRVRQPDMEYLIMRTQNGYTRCVATLSGAQGDKIEFCDGDVSLLSDAEYQIITRQSGLYGAGTLLTGTSPQQLRFHPLMAAGPEKAAEYDEQEQSAPLFLP